jgi:hypothetical protein
MWVRRLERIEECVGEFLFAVSFRNIEDQFSWAFAGVYGPYVDGDRRYLWDELIGLHSWWVLPWCIWGTSMSHTFLVRDWVWPIIVQLCWSFLISFRSRGSWIFL